MYKVVIAIVISLVWFGVAGRLFTDKVLVVDWVSSFFVYAIGLQWAIAYLCKKNMYTLYVGEPMVSGVDRFLWLRRFHFGIGLVLCFLGSSL